MSTNPHFATTVMVDAATPMVGAETDLPVALAEPMGCRPQRQVSLNRWRLPASAAGEHVVLLAQLNRWGWLALLLEPLNMRGCYPAVGAIGT